jgi:hypothetical protein
MISTECRPGDEADNDLDQQPTEEAKDCASGD